MIVIGIDPGIANTGFGVVRTVGERMVALDGGVIETAAERACRAAAGQAARVARRADPLARAEGDGARGPLLRQERRLRAERRGGARRRHAGRRQARGALLRLHASGGEEGRLRLRLGRQGQVQRMVASLLGLPEPPSPDHAADAFAVAICHAGTAAARNAEHFGRRRAGGAPAVPARQQLAG